MELGKRYFSATEPQAVDDQQVSEEGQEGIKTNTK